MARKRESGKSVLAARLDDDDDDDTSSDKFRKSHMRKPGRGYEGKYNEENWISIAAQINSVWTNHIKAKIVNTLENCKCRLCGNRDETTSHVTRERSKQAQEEY